MLLLKSTSLQKTLTLCLVLMLVRVGVPHPEAPIVEAQNSEAAITLRLPQYLRDLMDRSLIEDFKALHPNIQVVLSDEEQIFPQIPSSDLESHLDDVEAYVSSADVVFVTPQILTEIGTHAGYFLNLSPIVSADNSLNIDDFYAPVWESYQWDSGVWAIPSSTDVMLFSYDVAAFDAAGVAYPNPNWTLNDIANAAELLAQRDSSGAVVVPGFASFFENNLALLLRTLYGTNILDETVLPNTPVLNDPALAALIDQWVDLEEQGIVINDFHPRFNEIPLRVDSARNVNTSFGGSGGGGGGGGGSSSKSYQGASRSIALLPGGTAGLNVQGFAVSSGTPYPEAAYALATFLSNRVDIANTFFGVSPARRSVAEALATGDGIRFQPPYTSEDQAVIDAALENGLPLSERRFTLYLENAVNQISDEVDAQAALQEVEVALYDDLAVADNRNQTVSVDVVAADLPPELGADEISLKLGISYAAIASPNVTDDGWDTFFDDFAENDPRVGYVEVTEINSLPTTAELSENFDCFILPYNAIPSGDLTGLLLLDPLIDSDPNIVRSDFIGSVLEQVQADERIWALPLSIQPTILRYDPEILTSAGIPLPENGWSITEFVDALQQLKTSPDDPAPFVPIDFQGTYLMMLINAFGGIPIDYRTSPPTINFTEPSTVDAIRQALDLAKNGYIEYQELAQGGGSFSSDGRSIPLSHDDLSPGSPLSFMAGNLTGITLYPYGSTYRGLSYNMHTAYISANAQDVDACYRLITAAASQPELQSGMPARLSLVTNPTTVAIQGEAIVELYSQFEAALADPNTIVLPSFVGGGISANRFYTLYWFFRAADRYVFDDADLEVELSEAAFFTQSFLACAEELGNREDALSDQEYYESLDECAQNVDPIFRT